MKIAIIGASGFVGSALVERLWLSKQSEVVPVIHSSGNAWSIARYGYPLQPADVHSTSSLVDALDGCTHVVNCSRGGRDTMLKGLKNLLSASMSIGVRRFVHVSSVAVYGYRFAGETIDERCPERAPPRTYGDLKKKGDQLCARATRRGLPCVILCPPNITGINAPFLLGIVDALQEGKCALVDKGANPCEVIDVQNLVHAIELALTCDAAVGERLFVTNSDCLDWRTLFDDLNKTLNRHVDLESISSNEALNLVESQKPAKPSLRRAARHLLSEEVRRAFSADPLWNSLLAKSVSVLNRVAPTTLTRLRSAVAPGSNAQVRPRAAPSLSAALLDQQLRNVRYSNQRANAILGYEPVVSYVESMASFRRWYRNQFAIGTPSGDLLADLV